MPRTRSFVADYTELISERMDEGVKIKQVKLVKRYAGGIVCNLLEAFNIEWRLHSKRKLEQFYIEREYNDNRRFWKTVRSVLEGSGSN